MRTQTSTTYSVDNRYQEAQGFSDNFTGAKFLNQYLQRKRLSDIDRQGNKKELEGKFVLAGMGGTVPVSQLPGNLTNTDAKYAFRNTFRAAQS